MRVWMLKDDALWISILLQHADISDSKYIEYMMIIIMEYINADSMAVILDRKRIKGLFDIWW